MQIEFRQVPPPKSAPVNADAEALNLVRGLKAKRADYGCRCSNCSRRVAAGDWLIWVPDTVSRWDTAASIEEQCRRNAYNGALSGWCIRCAPKKRGPGLFRRLFGQPEGTGA